jgi:large subunit ribosomal protein L21
MYAVIESGGKQYRVELGSVIEVDRLDAEPGQTIDIERVLLVADGDEAAIGRPTVDGAKVSASVLRQDRGEKIVVFKYKPKARTRVKKGARADLTVLRIADIAWGKRSAAAEDAAAEAERAKAAAAETKAAEAKAKADAALAEKLAAEAATAAAPATEASAKPARRSRATRPAPDETTTQATADAPADADPEDPTADDTSDAAAATSREAPADEMVPVQTTPPTEGDDARKDE